MAKIFLVFLLLFVACEKKQPVVESPEMEKQKPKSSESLIKNAEPQFASFASLEREVSAKSKGTSVWEKAQMDRPLFKKDWVRTGIDSKTRIRLNSGPKIDLGEKTTLLLEGIDSSKLLSTKIRVPQGSVEAEIAAEDKGQELIFKFPNVWVKVKKALGETVRKVFVASLNKEKFEVKVEKGDVELVWSNKSQRVPQGEKFIQEKPELAQSEVDSEELAPPAYVEPKIEEKKEKKAQEKKSAPKKVATVAKKCRVDSPQSGLKTSKSEVWIRGVCPQDAKIVLKGVDIPVQNQKFAYKARLRKGINVFTLQIFRGENVVYKSIEIERQ